MVYIELCDIVPSAFIFCDEANIHSIPLSSIEEYGQRVVTFLNSTESSKFITYRLKFSPNKVKSFFEGNSFFSYNEGNNLVTLNEKVEIKDLHSQLSVLPKHIIVALRNQNLCKQLTVN